MIGSRAQKNTDELEEGPAPTSPSVKEKHKGEELQGKLAHSETADKLMRSVLENDKETIDQGMMLSESINQGLQSFSPDMMMQQLTENYRQAKQLYGERLLRALTGYDPSYIEKNVRIPEFKRELQDKLSQGIKNLQEKKLLDKEGVMTDVGFTLASVSMAMEELEHMNRKGVLGERANKSRSAAGEKADHANFNGHRFADIALKATIKKTLRRGHKGVLKDDLVVQEKESKERATIIYALDASGSMKGEKLAAAKRAGVALAFKATRKKDKVGVIVFGKDVEQELAPTRDFLSLVKTIVRARAAAQTDIAATINRSLVLFNHVREVKHLILLTDGLQTVGSESLVLEAASKAARQGVVVSVIGLSLDDEGKSLSKKIVDIGNGTLYLVKDYEQLDSLLIEAYYKTKH